MSDEDEESMSEGFSASEDEWKPSKDVRGGESSDDDDSDFEESPHALGAQTHGNGATTRRKGASPKSAVVKQTAIKKRKGAGQSLRTKLYNKYRPPPKTCPSPNSAGSNSPSASTSRTASKNVKMLNESGEPGSVSSSESSVDDYLVNPEDIDFQSSFFNVRNSEDKTTALTKPPVFDCNAGVGKLSDSGSEDNESSTEEQGNAKSFDFANLLDNVNSLERAKDTIAKRAAAKEQENTKITGRSGNKCNTTTMDVNTLLALGEAKQSHATMRSMKSKDDGEEEDDERDEIERGPQRLSKTKSTRVKRHTKTRPTSTVLAGDTDDSEFEEVAEDTGCVSHSTTHDSSALLNTTEGLEIHVELPSKQRRNKEKKQQDLEMALKRKLNRDLKERFLNLHKTSLLCCFARSYRYNRMLNYTRLMQAALKLLPSSNAYPPDRGTEIKYFQSMVTWYKTAVKLTSPNLYGEKVRKSRRRVKRELLEQIRKKEASCKQDFAFIFVILLRAMGLQCRLIVNMQPLPLRPAQSDLLTIKMKKEASEIKAEVEKIELEANKLKKEGLKKETSCEERTEKADRKREEKKREKDKEKVSNKEEKEKKEKKVEEALKEQNKTIKKELERKKNYSEKKEVARDYHKERKRALSAKLADMIASEKQVNGGDSEAKKAKTDINDTEQRNSKMMQASRNDANKEECKTLEPANKRKENIAINSDTRSLESNKTVDSEEDEDAARNSKPPKETVVPTKKPTLARLKSKRGAKVSEIVPKLSADKPCFSVSGATPIAKRTRQAPTKQQAKNKAITNITKNDKPIIQIGSPVLPKIVIQSGKTVHTAETNERKSNQTHAESALNTRDTRSRSKSPKLHISPKFLQSTNYKNTFPESQTGGTKPKSTRANAKSPTQKIQISTEFLKSKSANAAPEQVASGTRSGRNLRACQKVNGDGVVLPQLDGADDSLDKKKRPQLKKLKKNKSKTHDESDEDFEPSPPKQPKKAPNSVEKKKVAKDKTKVDRRVISSDDEGSGGGAVKRNPTAADIWVEAWSDAEEQWICIELFKGKLHSVDAIRYLA
ncbi:DNA repair protein complementing XP-C cells homolog isoform X3 [Eurosta solidaginis]|uniref:DNA repair protein complementing XP-C cells homolog isoform X3 n=1 Tax=Eurosta solidaginis TaxID=178769 RepID=UPI003530E268